MADAQDLIVGETYYGVQFVDAAMLVPEVRPFVFVGEDLEPGDAACLYFQDAASYLAGMRFGDTGTFHRVHKGTPFVLTFDAALEALNRCSLARSKRE